MLNSRVTHMLWLLHTHSLLLFLSLLLVPATVVVAIVAASAVALMSHAAHACNTCNKMRIHVMHAQHDIQKAHGMSNSSAISLLS